MLEQDRNPDYIFEGQQSVFVPRFKTEKSQSEAHENFNNLEDYDEEDEYLENNQAGEEEQGIQQTEAVDPGFRVNTALETERDQLVP